MPIVLFAAAAAWVTFRIMRRLEHPRLRCPVCAEVIQADARMCRWCRMSLPFGWARQDR